MAILFHPTTNFRTRNKWCPYPPKFQFHNHHCFSQLALNFFNLWLNHETAAVQSLKQQQQLKQTLALFILWGDGEQRSHHGPQWGLQLSEMLKNVFSLRLQQHLNSREGLKENKSRTKFGMVFGARQTCKSPEDLQRLQQTPQKPSREWLAVLPTTCGSVKDGNPSWGNPSQLPGQSWTILPLFRQGCTSRAHLRSFCSHFSLCKSHSQEVKEIISCFLWN